MDDQYTRGVGEVPSRIGPDAGAGMPQVVVVGSASRDIAPDDRRGWRLGGGAAYGALALARLGLGTGVVLGVDTQAASAAELDLLRLAGVDLRLVTLARAPVFENVERPEGRIQACLEPGDLLPPSGLPPEWRAAPAWLFAPVAGEIGEAWGSLPAEQALVALGWQGLLRRLPRGGLVERHAPQASSLVSRADIVGVSQADVDPATPLDDLLALLRPAATLLVTGGDRGGLVVEAGPAGRSFRRYAAIPSRGVNDPTGAGDVFLATFLAAAISPALRGSGRRGADLRLAAAAASLVVERPGLLGVPELDAVLHRVRASLRGTLHATGDGSVASGAAPGQAERGD